MTRLPSTALIVALLGLVGGCAGTETVDEPERAPPAVPTVRADPSVATALAPADSQPEPEPAPTIDELRRRTAEKPSADDDRAMARWRRDRVRLGDALLVTGDHDAARTTWREVAEPYKLDPFGAVPGEARDARIRLAFVGKAPPPIGPTEALGGEPVTWESLRGEVVVAHSFWTFCNPCRSSMLSLDAIKSRHGDRVHVIGLGAFTPFGQDGGRIPESREDVHSPVHFVEVANRDEFREHLIAFREVVRISYPWLVQDGARYVRWQLPENHPILLVGRDGTVAMAVRGPDLSPLEAVLEQLLANE